MGDKVTVDNITNITNSSGTATANENFDIVADEFDKVLYADGSIAAAGDIDMNGFNILNTPFTSVFTIAFKTWAQLQATPGTYKGQTAGVYNDTGTHTDPVVGGIVNNEGAYRWDVTSNGWERIGAVDTKLNTGVSIQTALGIVLAPSGDTTGVTDRTNLVAALALAVSGAQISLTPGDYYWAQTISVTTTNITIVGMGKVNIRPNTRTTPLDMLWFKTDGGRLRNVNFIGSAYTTEGSNTTLSVNRHVLVGLTTGLISDFEASGVTTYGGSTGMWITNMDRVRVTGCRFEKGYDYGLAVPSCRHLFISNIFCLDSGVQEGIKFGFDTEQITESVTISDFQIENCGHLSATLDTWQEGLDLFINNAQDISISDGIIRNCGNGGIEIKTNTTYGGGKVSGAFGGIRNVTIDNVDVIMGYDHGSGLSAGWGEVLNGSTGTTNPIATGADLAQKLSVRNMRVTYRPVVGQPATATSTAGIIVTAWTDTLISDVQITGCFTGIRLAGDGSSDTTNRRTSIVNPIIRGADLGMYMANGTFEEPQILGGQVIARIPLAIGGGSYAGAGSVTGGSIRGTRLISSGTTDNDNCVTLTNAFGFEIEDTYMECAYRPMVTSGAIAGPVSGRVAGGFVRRCTLKTTGTDTSKYHYALYGNHGTWIMTDCDVNFASVAVLGRTLVQGSGTVIGANNCRGLRSSIPSIGGSIGDIFRHSAPAAGGYMGWMATSVSDSAATWKQFGTIQA